MGKGLHLSGVNLSGNVFCLCLLCEDYRHMKRFCRDTGDSDSGSLDREDLVYILICETAFELFSNLLKQFNIHLMIQKTIYFQYISFLNHTVPADSVFQKLHERFSS